ncbi:MAG TPA: ABC transporter ATP-binding protein [Burkholderiales bacterium]|nr:ABC transporter ATP-binding protein [Burkholderiales bacterium]
MTEQVARSATAIAVQIRKMLAHAGEGRRARLATLLLLSLLAAVAEGAGLFLLVPLLRAVGLTGGEDGAWLAALLGPYATLETALAMFIALILLGGAVIRVNEIMAVRLRMEYCDTLRRQLHDAVLRMRWPAFQELRSSDVMHVVMDEVTRAGIALDLFIQMITAALTASVLFAVAVSLSPPLAVVAAAVATIFAVASRSLDRRNLELGEAFGRSVKALQARLFDDLAALRVIKSFGAERRRTREFAEKLSAFADAQMGLTRSVATGRALVRAGGAIAAAVGLAVAVRTFDMSVAAAIVFVLALGRLAMAGLRLQDRWWRFLNILPAYRAVETLLMRAGAVPEPAPDAQPAPALRREIRLERVSVRHGGVQAPALRDVSAVIPAGRTTAIVGPSGAGKSTLSDVLLGLLTPESGTVTIDGVPLEAARIPAWRNTVGYVPQDAGLLNDSVRANLLLARPEADDAALWNVLERAAVAEVVRALPHGLETSIGERGAKLSGGERQRIAIARALLRDAPLLLLDEATSALDAENERKVLEPLRCNSEHLTVIVIAHRAATVEAADHLLLLDRGRLVGSGSWEEVRGLATPALAELQLA